MGFLQRLQVKADNRNEKGSGNEDTFPLPPERRTFGPWEFVCPQHVLFISLY